MNSQEDCLREELDLFSPPKFQTSVDEGSWDKLAPLPGYNTSSASNLEFQYSGTDEYPDLDQTFLYLKVSIRKKEPNQNDYTPIKATDKIGPVNNFLHSIFKSATLFINNTSIENANDMYAYRAYIENLLGYSRCAKDSHLQNALFYKDTAGKMDKETPLAPVELTDTSTAAQIVAHLKSLDYITPFNEGLNERKKRFSKNSVELWGPVHIDMFNTNRYLLNNVPFRLLLTRNSDAFCLLGEKGVNSYAVFIENAYLYVRKQRLAPNIMANHIKSLQTLNCQYPIRKVEVRNTTINKGTQFEELLLCTGKMPRRLIFGLAAHSAVSGSYEHNPFEFEHFNLSSIDVCVAGHSMPYRNQLNMNFEQGTYAMAYNSLFQGINRYAYENGCDISYNEFAKGYALYAFNLTPDNCDGMYYSIPKNGELRLKLAFDVETPNNITCIYYLEFDSLVQITQTHNVIVDHRI